MILLTIFRLFFIKFSLDIFNYSHLEQYLILSSSKFDKHKSFATNRKDQVWHVILFLSCRRVRGVVIAYLFVCVTVSNVNTAKLYLNA